MGYPFALPRTLAGFTAEFMTTLLRHQGWIEDHNAVVGMTESGVGMTAGYFSALKKVTCEYRYSTSAPSRFVIKTWPTLEIMPRDSIAQYFRKDIGAYSAFTPDEFFPRPRVLLAAGDERENCWALIMEDAEVYATHRTHETQLSLDETYALIPGLVEQAVRWEGCDRGPAAARLDALGVHAWSSPENLGIYRALLPQGAPFLDRMLSTPSWISPTWPDLLGPGFCAEFTRRYDAWFAAVHPDCGATCTLSHGDLRGDNLFTSPPGPQCPRGWVVIDFQLMFRGPVPSDLAFLLNSGTVAADVYAGPALRPLLRTFYEAFMARTRRYPDYSYAQFEREYVVMSTVEFVYFVGMGAAVWKAGALRNELAARVELGTGGATEASLSAEERRQRMWWRKTHANLRDTFSEFDVRERLQALAPDTPVPVFDTLPDHLAGG